MSSNSIVRFNHIILFSIQYGFDKLARATMILENFLKKPNTININTMNVHSILRTCIFLIYII